MSANLAVVLGSGLGWVADQMELIREVSFAEAGLVSSRVAGHQGRFLLGRLHQKTLWMMQGRIHLYEGHSAYDVTRGVRWLQSQGVESLILTNAAGALRENDAPGAWMILSDHLNLTGTSPLEGAPNFIDMSDVYTREWRECVIATALQSELKLVQGVYAGLRGPQYETPAEIRMLRTMGADAVGMSTVLEAIQARALGMRVLGFSCLTNWAAGMTSKPLDHGEVLDAGKESAGTFEELLRLILELE